MGADGGRGHRCELLSSIHRICDKVDLSPHFYLNILLQAALNVCLIFRPLSPHSELPSTSQREEEKDRTRERERERERDRERVGVTRKQRGRQLENVR